MARASGARVLVLDVTTVREARRRAPVHVPPETAALLQAGKLEQTCRNCGRWEAAGPAGCSWCGLPVPPADWYRNGDAKARAARLPVAAPVNPPAEFHRAYRPDKGDGWPPQWGPNPYLKAPQPVGKPPKHGDEPSAAL